MRWVLSFLSLRLSGIALADQNPSFQEGRTLGSGATQGAFSSISNGTAAGNIPSYGSSAAETPYFQGGQGQPAGAGVTRMQGCAGYTPGANAMANQECEAINLLARNPEIRPQFSITPNDPMVLSSRNVSGNAESFFQSIGINGGTGSNTQCTARTEITPARYSTQICTISRQIASQQCTRGRVVNIDTDANYQCDQALNTYETQTCNRTYNAQVNYTCATGTFNPTTLTCDLPGDTQSGQQTAAVSCSSNGYNYAECGVSGIAYIDIIYLIERHSKSSCNGRFGITGDHQRMWVNGGCRGTFGINGQGCSIGYTWDNYSYLCISCPSGSTYNASRQVCETNPQINLTHTVANNCAALEARAQ